MITKIICALLCAMVAGGIAIVMQGVGLQCSIITWAIWGGVIGLVGSFLIGV